MFAIYNYSKLGFVQTPLCIWLFTLERVSFRQAPKSKILGISADLCVSYIWFPIAQMPCRKVTVEQTGHGNFPATYKPTLNLHFHVFSREKRLVLL